MKIVCEACEAKYSIADEKVQGKVFKIRCKKCGQVIVVRPEARVLDPDSAGAAPAPAADDAIWHVVIDQQQVGPMALDEVRARLAAGELDAESYAWREGLADWQPIAQVGELAALLEAPGAPVDFPAQPGAQAMGALAAQLEPTPERAPAAPHGLATATAAPREPVDSASKGAAMKGQRNESSVLFSLGNLSAIAAEAPRAPGGSSSAPGAAGHGGSEGSGLIDIRSMASAYLGPKAAAKGPAAPRVGSADDLPVFSAAAFSEPAVIIPMGGARNQNRMLYVLLGAVALLAILAVVLVVVVMGKKTPASPSVANASPRTEPTSNTPSSTTPTTTTPTTTTPTTNTPTTTTPTTTPPSATTTTTPTTNTPATTTPTTTTPTTSPTRTNPTRTTTTPTTSPTRTSPTRTTTTPPVKTEPAGKCSLDETGCLLASRPPACCEIYSGRQRSTTTTTTTTKPPVATGDLPESLTKATISAGLATVQSKAKACGAKSSAKGRVMIAYKVAASGAVTTATVKESPDSALGACVASAAKTGKFPPTQTGGSFQYPYNF